MHRTAVNQISVQHTLLHVGWKDFPANGRLPHGGRGKLPHIQGGNDAWVKEIKSLEETTQTLSAINPVVYEPLRTYLLRKYVDDVLTSLEKMKLGVRWEPQHKCFMWSQENEDIDKAQVKNQEINTMEQFTRMASGILACLQFTFDPVTWKPGSMEERSLWSPGLLALRVKGRGLQET